MTFERMENETRDELLLRIGQLKEQIGTWQDVADILNRLLNENHSESTYRKDFKRMNRNNTNNVICKKDKIDNKIEEIKKERIKLQTEKLEMARWRREDSRDELIIEKIQNAINQLPKLTIPDRSQFENFDNNTFSSKEYLLTFGDCHYGKDLEIRGLSGEILNKYSPEKCEERLWKLLYKIEELVKKENIKKLNVWDLGDELDGMLRVSQLMTLRYGVIDSSVKFAEILANWLNELTKFVNVRFQMCKDSNHCELRELGQPKGSFKQDNLSKVILAFVKIRLKDNPYIKIIENPTGYLFDEICGYKIFGFHGEARNMPTALKDFSITYGTQINYLVAAHIHHNKSEEIGFDTEVINIPSVVGVDDYSMSIRKTSNAGAKLLIFKNNEGLCTDYRIKL